MEGLVLFGLVAWLIGWTAIGGIIGRSKGRTVQGVLLGLLLSFLGVIIIALLPPTEAALRRRYGIQAEMLKEAVGSARASSLYDTDTRRVLIQRAIQENPELASDDSAEALERLGEIVDKLAAAEALREERELALDEARRVELADQLKRQEEEEARARIAREAEALRVYEAQVSAMSPLKRFRTRHPAVFGVGAAALGVGVVAVAAVGIQTWMNASSAANLKERVLVAVVSGMPECASTSPSTADCDFSKVDLSGEDLTGANFQGLILTDANFENATLDQANFNQTVLVQSNFAGAKIRGATFADADLTDASLLATDLTSSDLTRAVLVRANLADANISRSDLSFADLSDADVTRTLATDTTWKGALCPSGNPSGGLDCIR